MLRAQEDGNTANFQADPKSRGGDVSMSLGDIDALDGPADGGNKIDIEEENEGAVWADQPLEAFLQSQLSKRSVMAKPKVTAKKYSDFNKAMVNNLRTLSFLVFLVFIVLCWTMIKGSMEHMQRVLPLIFGALGATNKSKTD